MFIDFEKMPLSSRIWVYQSEKPVPEEVTAAVKSFVESWEVHGQPLKASFQVFYEHFLVLAVDENYNQVSGCSIDKSVHFVQDLEKTFGINLFDRMKQAYWQSGTIVFRTQKQIKEAIQAGLFDRNTLIFNNLVRNIEELVKNWEIPAEQSWLKRFFALEASV